MKSEDIHPKILEAFPDSDPKKKISEEKKGVIGSLDGPHLIIAGPGSGKTYTLVLRTLNILLKKLAEPSEIMLCTFTEKSAFELRDRLSNFAKKLGYDQNIQEVTTGTIHGLCHYFLSKYRHHTSLKSNFELLDDLTQELFIFDNFEDIISKKGDKHKPYLGKWNTEWSAVRGIIRFFDKITEELIDPKKLLRSDEEITKKLGRCYIHYEECLKKKNRVDMAHLQKYFYELLDKKKVGDKIISSLKYIMVDEYQDTNYIQEQIMIKLSSKSNNLCVVGDEDQSLYRFRGATVRNILEFKDLFKNCKEFVLETNYRSHREIIDFYNKFMDKPDWKSESNKRFRYPKKIKPDPTEKFPDYPAVFKINGDNEIVEAEKFADFVSFLKKDKIIQDYNQIALLLYSVRIEHSGPYIDALAKLGIPSFCPRKRAFFSNEEVQRMISCLSLILGYHGENRGNVNGRIMPEITAMIDQDIEKIKDESNDELLKELDKGIKEINFLKYKPTLDKRLVDYLYQLISVEPFKSWLEDENKARNISMLSYLLTVFQNYYHYTVITQKNLPGMRLKFFNSFLRLLFEKGKDEFEDPDMPFPKGYVQIMTIHQSKGLEFPVVVVGSLDRNPRAQKDVDRVLSDFYARPLFEPEDKVKIFDYLRLYYVAFSRAQKVLALTCSEDPSEYFEDSWNSLEEWPHKQKDLLKSQTFEFKERDKIKKGFSFTSDLNLYEDCPRQYKFFNELEFTPSRSAEVFFGSLVHQTIEEIHRYAIEDKLKELNEKVIRDIFEFNFRMLIESGMRPLAQKQKEIAFDQVICYYKQNKKEMQRIKEIEVDVSLEKEKYILNGKIDLVLGKDDKLEILDFKAQKKPKNDKVLIEKYRKQLCIYGHILEQRYKKKPQRLVIYWTGEKDKNKARMVFDYDHLIVDEAVKEFDTVVDKILKRDFEIKETPKPEYCRECDLKRYCVSKNTIKLK